MTAELLWALDLGFQCYAARRGKAQISASLFRARRFRFCALVIIRALFWLRACGKSTRANFWKQFLKTFFQTHLKKGKKLCSTFSLLYFKPILFLVSLSRKNMAKLFLYIYILYIYIKNISICVHLRASTRLQMSLIQQFPCFANILL
jgi:hypothetical protein